MVNLKPYTVYRVWVAAATGAGIGPFGNHTETRTFGDVPEVKVRLTGLSAMCPAGLLVEWAGFNSKQLNGPIEEIKLVINYTDVGSGNTDAREVKYYDGNTVRDRLYTSKCRGSICRIA